MITFTRLASGFLLTLPRGTQQKQVVKLACTTLDHVTCKDRVSTEMTVRMKGGVTEVIFILPETLSGVQFEWQKKLHIKAHVLFSL